jgi:hypothetical protein
MPAMKRFLTDLRAIALAGVFALLATTAAVYSQAFTLPAGTTFTNMMVSQGSAPTGTGCTIVAGSTDGSGACLTTATSGSISFSRTYSSAPNCIVVDRTATPVAVYSVTTIAIVLATVTSAHNLTWRCDTPAY